MGLYDRGWRRHRENPAAVTAHRERKEGVATHQHGILILTTLVHDGWRRRRNVGHLAASWPVEDVRGSGRRLHVLLAPETL